MFFEQFIQYYNPRIKNRQNDFRRQIIEKDRLGYLIEYFEFFNFFFIINKHFSNELTIKITLKIQYRQNI